MQPIQVVLDGCISFKFLAANSVNDDITTRLTRSVPEITMLPSVNLPDPETAAELAVPLLLAYVEKRPSGAVSQEQQGSQRRIAIDAQRRELRKLASSHSLTIIGEYTDAVESGKDDHRPGFQALRNELQSSERSWSTILMLDTSRLSRRRVNALVFEEMEAKKRGVRIIYKSLPDNVDPIQEMLLKAIMQAIDEWHSLSSKQKGLAGMRENVHKGFRAGGRAPAGYRLEHVDTGVVREGVPVMKSRLVPGADAERVRQYLKARAIGKPRAELRGILDKPQSTLISIERNALTYAGHTVWNRHQETSSGGYIGETKFRPKEEWVVQRDTHPALINETEADAILAALDNRKRPRARASDYLLTGMLVTPSGAAWWGNGDGRYRNGSKNVTAAKLEQAIVGQVARDLRSPAFVTALVKRARAAQHPTKAEGRAKMLRQDLDDHERRMAKIANCIPEMKNPRPLVAKLEEMDAERARLLAELKQAQADRDVVRALSQITERDVERMLDTAIEQMEQLEQGELKDFLRGLVGKIELDPATLTCRMHYRIPLRLGVKVASPGGFERPLPP